MENRIKNMKAGETIKLSESNGIRCEVERSGDGKTLRYVRHTGNGWRVFRTASF